MLWKLKEQIYDKLNSQINFSRVLGITDTKVSKVIKGHTKLDPKTQTKWAKALGCSREEIFGQE